MKDFSTKKKLESELALLEGKHSKELFTNPNFYNNFAGKLSWHENWANKIEISMRGIWDERRASRMYQEIEQWLDKEEKILTSKR